MSNSVKNHLSDAEILSIYKPMVKFLAQLCGPSTEVVLHDIAHPQKSVIAIENGYHSGRDIGSPLTDFSMDIIESKKYVDLDYIGNYSGASKGKDFLSSTFFIKNDDRLIGLLCINKDVSRIRELQQSFESLKQMYNLEVPDDNSVKETLDTSSVDQMMQSMVDTTINEQGIPGSRMKIDEKVQVIHRLKTLGVLNMRGSIAYIAQQLSISEPTVYRYAKKEPNESAQV